MGMETAVGMKLLIAEREMSASLRAVNVCIEFLDISNYT